MLGWDVIPYVPQFNGRLSKMSLNRLIACLIAVVLFYSAHAMAHTPRHRWHHPSAAVHHIPPEKRASATDGHQSAQGFARASQTYAQAVYRHAAGRKGRGGEQPTRRNPFIVAIDAGHGGKDTGAIGPNGIFEKNVVYAISRQLEQLIGTDANMKPVMVRRGDTFIGLQRRAQIARDAGADLFVSLHADAFHDDGARGSAVFTLPNHGKGHGGNSASTRKASNRAAVKILGELRKQQYLHCRQVKRARYAVLKSPDVPSMLIETGFITNPLEEGKLASHSHQEKLAHSIYNGIRAYARTAKPKHAKPSRSKAVVVAARQ
jgi:N-acetylmuramoyl-L-alanine amidase